MYDTIIIGSGPAGMTAAIYLRRANKKVLIIEKEAPGGQLVKTDLIENYPGFKTVSGPDLAFSMYEHVMSLDTEFVFEEVTNISQDKFFTVSTTENKYATKSIIYATGNTNKSLNVPGERKLRGKGVSFCATCDGSLYKGQDVCVVGSNDAAFEESIYLADICKNVYLISENLTENKDLLKEVQSRENIKIYEKTKVIEFIGLKELEKVKCKSFDNEFTLDVKCAFLYLGFAPAGSALKGLSILDGEGYISVNNELETPVKGIFGAGDCIKKTLRQVVTAASDGAIAATSCIKYLQKVKED